MSLYGADGQLAGGINGSRTRDNVGLGSAHTEIICRPIEFPPTDTG